MNTNQTNPRRTSAQPSQRQRQQAQRPAQGRNPSPPHQQTQRPQPQTNAARTQHPQTDASVRRTAANPNAQHPTARRPVRTPPPPQSAPKSAEQEQPLETVIRLRGSVDRPFLILVIVLVLIGSAMVFSASYAYAEYHFGDSLYFISSQLKWVAVGFALMFVAMNFDYRWLPLPWSSPTVSTFPWHNPF